MGTDTGVPYTQHGNNLDELSYLVEMGLTPHEAISAATIGAAKLLKMADRIGSIEAGKLADFIIVDGDPIADIGILRDKNRITNVAIGGQMMVDRSSPANR
jgi:imidazolonepropionase-like amidohydrolase